MRVILGYGYCGQAERLHGVLFVRSSSCGCIGIKSNSSIDFLYMKVMIDKYVRLARSLAQPGSARVARRTCGREGAPHLGIRQLMTFQRGRWEGGFSDELLSSKDVDDEVPCVFICRKYTRRLSSRAQRSLNTACLFCI